MPTIELFDLFGWVVEGIFGGDNKCGAEPRVFDVPLRGCGRRVIQGPVSFTEVVLEKAHLVLEVSNLATILISVILVLVVLFLTGGHQPLHDGHGEHEAELLGGL